MSKYRRVFPNWDDRTEEEFKIVCQMLTVDPSTLNRQQMKTLCNYKKSLDPLPTELLQDKCLQTLSELKFGSELKRIARETRDRDFLASCILDARLRKYGIEFKKKQPITQLLQRKNRPWRVLRTSDGQTISRETDPSKFHINPQLEQEAVQRAKLFQNIKNKVIPVSCTDDILSILKNPSILDASQRGFSASPTVIVLGELKLGEKSGGPMVAIKMFPPTMSQLVLNAYKGLQYEQQVYTTIVPDLLESLATPNLIAPIATLSCPLKGLKDTDPLYSVLLDTITEYVRVQQWLRKEEIPISPVIKSTLERNMIMGVYEMSKGVTFSTFLELNLVDWNKMNRFLESKDRQHEELRQDLKLQIEGRLKINGKNVEKYSAWIVSDFPLQLTQILFQIIWTLHVLHKIGCVHNDLHGGNVWVEPRTHLSNVFYHDLSTHRVWLLLDSKFTARIYDFDRAYCKSLGTNPLCDERCKSRGPDHDLYTIYSAMWDALDTLQTNDVLRSFMNETNADGIKKELLALFQKDVTEIEGGDFWKRRDRKDTNEMLQQSFLDRKGIVTTFDKIIPRVVEIEGRLFWKERRAKYRDEIPYYAF